MKKIGFLICAIFIALCSMTAMGKTLERGYRGFLEWNFEVGSHFIEANHNHTASILGGFSTSHGYQFNKHLYIGGGFWLPGNIQHDYWWYFISTYSAIPVFIHGRTDWTFGKVPLFLDMRIGFVPIGGYKMGYGHGQPFFTPHLGFRWAVNSRVSWNLSFGASIHKLKYFDPAVDDKSRLVMPSMKIGIDF